MNEYIYKYVDLKGLKLILENQTLKFTNPNDFNDPFEFHENLVDRKLSAKHQLEIIKKHDKNLTKEKLRRYKIIINQDIQRPDTGLIQMFEKRKIESKVSCFSEINDNILMWAHYADKHRGICIKFNSEKLFSSFKKKDSYPCKIKYQLRIKTKKLSKLREEAIVHWISSKGIDWKYEKEIRIILGSNQPEILPFNIDSIEEVIFGCKSIEKERLDIEDLIFQKQKYNWIHTSEMTISDKKYELIKNNRR